MVTEKIYLSGVVQGVGCRFFTWKKAQSLGLLGWVRNLADGRVEILVQGEKNLLDDFALWLKDGIKSAKVEKIQREEIDTSECFKNFDVRR